MNKKTGYVLTVFGAICWAFSGACGQYLFQHRGLDADWLVSVRLTMAGLLLVLYSLARWRGGAVRMFHSGRSIGAILVFAVFGMAMCQYSYFRSIELSNAATATTLQYTGPALVLLWLALREKRMPAPKELIAVVCAMGGAFYWQHMAILPSWRCRQRRCSGAYWQQFRSRYTACSRVD